MYIRDLVTTIVTSRSTVVKGGGIQEISTYWRNLEILELEAVQRWSGDTSRVTLNSDLSEIPFVH